MTDQIKFIDFEGVNQMRGAPKNWDKAKYGECDALPVANYGGVCTSCWRPTLRQLIKLAFGKRIFLHVVGEQPAVALNIA